MFCLAHRAAWPPWPDTSQLFSLERLPCPAFPGPKARVRAGLTSCLRWPQKTPRDNFSLKQANECIHLSFFPPTSLSTNSIHCLAVDETKGKCWEGWGCPPHLPGEAHLAPEILAPFLGAVCSVSQHLHDQFPELKLPGVLILPLPVHLCPEGPFQMDTNCGGCTLLAAPMPPGPGGPASQSLNWQGPVCI